MNVFNHYARYYDALYSDKNYYEEAEYIANLISEFNPGSRDILELGCGTGSHAFLLAKKDFVYHGIDLSAQMIAAANAKVGQASDKVKARVCFEVGDARGYQTDLLFDAVISLFHVFSYQTSNDDLEHCFNTAFKHLKEGGILIVDYWFGPAVIHQKPQPRIKRFIDQHGEIVRFADSTMFPVKNVVDVNYQIFFNGEKSTKLESLSETHSMRYLFIPELKYLAKKQGFEIVTSRKWLGHEAPDLESWAACSVFKKVGSR